MVVPGMLTWHPLDVFATRFRQNLAALQGRDPNLAGRLAGFAPAAPMLVAAQGDEVFLARRTAAGPEVLPNPLPPAAARHFAAGLFPAGAVHAPIVIGGLGYGWLWDLVTKMPCKVDAAPGHRPPIYLLAGEIERFWAVLHLLDWRAMLADPRFPIFVGPDAAAQLRQALIDDVTLPRPVACLRVEQSLWAEDFQALLAHVAEATDAAHASVTRRLAALYPAGGSQPAAGPNGPGRSLRVLGITSRYTTFLQHSMRDWLAGFEALGHQARLVIESADHVMMGAVGVGQAVLEHRPDLIVIIDHYRAEIPTLPKDVPCVMWVQDRLPNIYSDAGGTAQGRMDYCIGFGRLHLSTRHGYPADRFMSCPVGTNERRFDAVELTPADHDRFGCDVSYVSHASRPAQDMVREYAQRSGSADVARLCDDLYQRLEAWYAGGGVAISEVALRQMLALSAAAVRFDLPDRDVPGFLGFVHHSINNAIFRHQTLGWLADLGLNLHLWGKGWDRHPALRRFARGVADNQSDLPKIYRASRINIQVTPHGSVHQRLIDGLAAGGFFLLRWHPGDVVGLAYREMLDWCRSHGIHDDAALHARADQRIRQLIARVNELETSTADTRVFSVFDVMNGHADGDFTTSAATIWPEYEQVAFNTRAELAARVQRFLGDPALRESVARSMRQAVIERCSYTNITRRLLAMIEQDLSGSVRCAA